MCGRYRPTVSWAEIHRLYRLTLDLQPAPNLQPVYNAAPTMRLPVVRQDAEGRRRLDLLRWGLVPFWAKDLAIGNRCINARVETVATAPAFRAAFKARRCLVPAEGFYEWTGRPGHKQPWLISLAEGGAMTMAGLWEHWAPEGQEPVESFTIITGPANSQVARLHDRMPVLLRPAQFDAWLAGPPEAARAALAPYDGDLRIVPVNKAMSNVRNQAAEDAAEVGPALA